MGRLNGSFISCGSKDTLCFLGKQRGTARDLQDIKFGVEQAGEKESGQVLQVFGVGVAHGLELIDRRDHKTTPFLIQGA